MKSKYLAPFDKYCYQISYWIILASSLCVSGGQEDCDDRDRCSAQAQSSKCGKILSFVYILTYSNHTCPTFKNRHSNIGVENVQILSPILKFLLRKK